jgi:hypothetical protein
VLCCIIHVSLEVPLSRHIVGTLLRRLVICFDQKVPHLLQIRLTVSVVNPIPIKVVRVGPDVIRVIPDEVGVIPSEIWVIVDVNSVISVDIVVRTQRGTWVPPIPVIYAGIPIVIDIRTYSIEWGCRNGEHSRSVGVRTSTTEAKI